MESWKFYDITHRMHIICNPMSSTKIQRLVDLLRLPADAHVLDIACGKGEFVLRLAERYGCSGVGVDMSPYVVAEAAARLKARPADFGITFIEMDAAEYSPGRGESFDLSSCLGASWIYGGYAATLKALFSMTKEDGLIVVGEPHWVREPDPAFLASSGLEQSTYGTLNENVFAGEALGLASVYTMVSSLDDWDHYYGLWTLAANNYALANPEDPDVTELLKRATGTVREHFRWGRDTLGWAIHVFRKSTA